MQCPGFDSEPAGQPAAADTSSKSAGCRAAGKELYRVIKMVVGTAAVVAGIQNAQSRITNSLESLTNESIESRVQEANKQFRGAGIRGGVALALSADTRGISIYTDFKYELPISNAVVLVGTAYGMIQSLKWYYAYYTANEGLRILQERQNS